MGLNRTNLAIYVVIAVVAAAAVFFAVRGLINPAYSLTVSMSAPLPSHIYPYNATIFKVNVTNTGSSQISNLPLGFYVNNNETHFYNVTIPVHQSAVVNITYTFSTPGNYVFKALADPGMLSKISDRQKASSTISGVHVLVPESPNLYLTMPNGTIKSNNFYAFSQRGVSAAVIIAESYGLSDLTGLFGHLYYIGGLASLINDAEGAAVTYQNGTSINSMWLQGSISPYWINYMLSGTGIKSNVTSINGTTAYYYGSNGTTACVFYQSGWTRLVEYSGAANEIAGQACSAINARYTNTFNTSLASAINSSNSYNYSARMVYSNSTGIGEAASHAIPSNTTGLSVLFQNAYGTFISTVTRHSEVNVSALNLTCLGLTFSSNTLNACSSVILPAANSPVTGYDMLNTTEITPNYTLTLYSVVNQTGLLSAHYSAIALLTQANAIAPSAVWASAFKNTCGLGSNSLGCAVNGFNFSTNTASLTIRNNLPNTVTLDRMDCYMYTGGTPTSINKTIAAHGSLNMSVPCSAAPVPLASAFSLYNVTTNYTYNGAHYTIRGNLNITNFLQG